MTNPIPLHPHAAQTATATAAEGAAIPALRCPNMIAIASGKGGVGKTWFSISLCHALAKRGKRVLLFDGDLGLANVDIQLGLTPERDLGHVVDNGLPLAEAVTRYTEGGFDILAGRSGSGSMATLGSQKVSDMRGALIELAQTYDHVFVDLGAGVDRAVRQMAGPAAMTYVVITDEPTSLTDAYAFIKLARAANPAAQLSVIVNMAASASDGQKTYDTIAKVTQTFLKMTPPLAGVIRRDPKVREAIRAQTSLMTRSPTSEAAADVEAVAGRLLQAG